MINNSINNVYAFVLGRELDLASEELKAVLDRFGFCHQFTDANYKITGNIAFINIDKNREEVSALFSTLGGSLKVYAIVGSIRQDITDQLSEIVLKEKKASGKVDFAISSYSKDFQERSINRIGLTVKKKLKAKASSRFIMLKGSDSVSTIVSLKNKLVKNGVEIGIFDGQLGVLIGLSNPEDWAKRDYGKPAFDKFSGMLPPKLARIMINLALGQIQNHESRIMNHGIENCDNIVVVDPFCGSGNILMEGMMLGCDVIGSDLSDKAVRDSQENITWLKSEFLNKSEEPKAIVFRADATRDEFIENCKPKIENYKNLVFVSEPYLGEPKRFKPTLDSAREEYREVKKIYLGFLRNIAKLLNCSIAELPNNLTPLRPPFVQGYEGQAIQQFNNPVLCIVFPLVETKDRGIYSLFRESVDEIKNLGYTQIHSNLTKARSSIFEGLVYGRDYQVVKRQIVLLEKTI